MTRYFEDHDDPIYIEFIESETWKRIRVDAIMRQGKKCNGCGKHGKSFDVHHLSYDRFGGNEKPYDLLVVCRECHIQIHNLVKNGMTLLNASDAVAPGARNKYLTKTIETKTKKSKILGTKMYRGIKIAINPGEGHCKAVTRKGSQCGSSRLENGFCHVHNPEGKFQQSLKKNKPKGSRARTEEHLAERREKRKKRKAE